MRAQARVEVPREGFLSAYESVGNYILISISRTE